MVHTEADFERLSWHDCHIWSLELRVGDPDEGDWTSDLALGIDWIEEWICRTDGGGEFRVAPAELVFHGVTDPSVALAWHPEGPQAALHLVSIDRIEREPQADQRVFLDRPYWRWRVRANWPRDGEIAFGAVGFTQTPLGEPLLLEGRQHLTRSERARSLGRR